MKFSSLKRDLEKVEAGEWIKNIPGCEGLEVLVRGSNNKDWRRMVQRLLSAVPRNKRVGGVTDPDEMDRITSTVILQTALLDWKGIEDDDGTPVPFSKEKAKAYLFDAEVSDFRDGVAWACDLVGRIIEGDIDDTLKN